MKFTTLSKIGSPTLPPAVLHRQSLITRLHEIIAIERDGESVAHNKLVLICAPAGYGKTTLLADFAHHSSITCCWYFLDSTDTEKQTFLTTLLTSIRYRFPGFGAALDSLLIEQSATPFENEEYTSGAFIDALVTAIETEITQQFLLILCNYHEVDESPAITSLVNLLLQKLPSHCTLIIESRATPSIEFVSLLAHRQAIGWGSNMLRMKAQEILELARIQGATPLTELEAEQLAQAFDGWITGILLGTRLGDTELLHASTRTGNLPGLPSIRVERQRLFAYLVDEIFKRQPANYAFLKDAAIFQQMVPAMCDKLLGINNSSEYLKELVRQGMFVTCSDEGPIPIYTCHPILRELLYDDLRHQSPERFAELHQLAAEQFAAAAEYDKAIFHALEAGDNQNVARLIIKAYQEMSTSEYPETLLRWIDRLPPTDVQLQPQLLIIRASIFLRRGAYYQALPLLDAASTLQTDPKVVIDPIDLPKLNAEIMILRSKALFQLGKYQEAQQLCLQILEITPMDEAMIRAEAHARFGICANLSGELSSGREHLQKALQLWGRHSVRLQTADAHSALAVTYSLMGNFALAEHHISRAISSCNQLHDEKGKVNNLTRMGNLKQSQGASSEAEAILLQALNTARNGTLNFEREEAYVLDSLGSIYQDQGRYDQSLQVIEQALELARKVRDNYSMNCSLCSLAMTYLLMDDPSTALLLLSESNLPPQNSKSISFERASHDLTFGTILLHQKRYDDAYTCFTALDASLQAAGLKREMLLVKLYVAACLLSRGERAEVLNYLDEVTTILERQESYKQLILTRLGRLPSLHQFISTQPALKALRATLLIKEPVKEPKEAVVSSTSSLEAAAPTSGAQPQIKVLAFGEPAVFLDGQPVTRWRMARSMELFFFLLDCGRPMRKERIITALWPQVDEQTNQTFHSTIYYLRKALNDSYITSRGGIYSLDLSSLQENQMQYDVASFKEYQAQARQFLADENDAEAKEALLAMVQFYQGDYVQPFYGDWCTFRRDELRRIYLETRNHLAHIAWRQEELDESAVHWQHMLAMDNCLEEAHYGLIKFYSRKGNRGLALRQYQRCAETLKQELATRPGPAIQNLYQRLIGSSESVKKNVRGPSRSGEVTHTN